MEDEKFWEEERKFLKFLMVLIASAGILTVIILLLAVAKAGADMLAG